MLKLSRLAGIAVCAALFAAAGCASNSGVTPAPGSAMQSQAMTSNHAGTGWVTQNGVTFHTPHYMPTRNNVQKNVKPDGILHYGGGRLLYTPKIYLVFWGYKAAGDPDHVKKLLKLYAKNLGGSPLNNVLTQYAGTGGNITNPSNQYAGTWLDNTNTVPAHPTDQQIATEALAGEAHFGYDVNGSYVVAIAHNHSPSGFGTQYCAYHSNVNSPGGSISYTNLPYMPDAAGSCGANIITPPSDQTGTNEGVTIVEGHELAESVTDPDPFSGWNSSQGEIGDLCAWTNIQNDPFGTYSFTAQPEYSNASSSCVHSYP